MEPSEKGTLVYPSLQGSTNWASPSYSPVTGMLYVPVREMGSIYFKTGVEYQPGTYYTGGSEKRLDEESWGAVRALDVKTGKQAWDFKLPSPPWAGVMSTAGGLVFGGSNEGNFFALDARTDRAASLELPQRLAGPRVEREEIALRRSAEHETARCRHHARPGRRRQLEVPHLFAGLDVERAHRAPRFLVEPLFAAAGVVRARLGTRPPVL